MARKESPAPLISDSDDGMIQVATPQESAESRLAQARQASASAALTAPTHFPDATLGEDDEEATGLETLADQMRKYNPEALAASERRQAEMVSGQKEEFDEIPARQKEAMQADMQRNLQRAAADTGVNIAALGFASATKEAMARETQHVIWLMPFDQENPETPREFSINMVPFVIEVGRPKRVPRSVVEFCVTHGYCAAPRELAQEFEDKNIRPPHKQRQIGPAGLALITPETRSGLYLGDDIGHTRPTLAGIGGGW